VISRRTIIWFILFLVAGGGMRFWLTAQWKDCERIAMQRASAATQTVTSGEITLTFPCRSFSPRQPVWVQLLSLFEFIAIVVFAIYLWTDINGWIQMRQRNRLEL
jgi:hypothetical protein